MLDAKELMNVIKYEREREERKQIAFLGNIADMIGYDDVVGRSAMRLWDDIIKNDIKYAAVSNGRIYHMDVFNENGEHVRSGNYLTKEDANTIAKEALSRNWIVKGEIRNA